LIWAVHSQGIKNGLDFSGINDYLRIHLCTQNRLKRKTNPPDNKKNDRQLWGYVGRTKLG